MSIISYLQETIIHESQTEAKQIAMSDKYTFNMDDLKFLKQQLGDPELYKYMGWIARNWDAVKKDEIGSLIKTYKTLVDRNLLQDKLPQYKDFNELIGRVNELKDKESKAEKRTKSEAQIYTLWDHNNISVVVPKTKMASIKHGRGSRWCTAADTNGDNDYDPGHMFCKYVLAEYGLMIYIINNNLSDDDKMQKMAIRLYDPYGEYEPEIAEIRDKSNSYNYTGNIGKGWDEDFQEYIDEWDIPLDEILDEVSVNDVEGERHNFHQALEDEARDSLKNTYSDVPESILSILDDVFDEMISDAYEYGIDEDERHTVYSNVADRINSFHDDIATFVESVKDSPMILNNIDWEELFKYTFKENEFPEISGIIDDYLSIDDEDKEDLLQSDTMIPLMIQSSTMFDDNALMNIMDIDNADTDIAHKLASIIRDNYEKIKKNILNTTSNTMKYDEPSPYGHKVKTPMSMKLRKRMKSLPYMSDAISFDIRRILKPVIDKLYNDLIDYADNMDDPVRDDWISKHQSLWNRRDESIKITHAQKYINEYFR